MQTPCPDSPTTGYGAWCALASSFLLISSMAGTSRPRRKASIALGSAEVSRTQFDHTRAVTALSMLHAAKIEGVSTVCIQGVFLQWFCNLARCNSGQRHVVDMKATLCLHSVAPSQPESASILERKCPKSFETWGEPYRS